MKHYRLKFHDIYQKRGKQILILINFRLKWVTCDYDIIVPIKSVCVIQYLKRVKKQTQQGK